MEKKEKKKRLSKKWFIYFLNCFYLKKRKMLVFNKSLFINSLILKKDALIYNGASYRSVFLTLYLKLLKFGFFVFTRKPFKYLIVKKSKR